MSYATDTVRTAVLELKYLSDPLQIAQATLPWAASVADVGVPYPYQDSNAMSASDALIGFQNDTYQVLCGGMSCFYADLLVELGVRAFVINTGFLGTPYTHATVLVKGDDGRYYMFDPLSGSYQVDANGKFAPMSDYFAERGTTVKVNFSRQICGSSEMQTGYDLNEIRNDLNGSFLGTNDTSGQFNGNLYADLRSTPINAALDTGSSAADVLLSTPLYLAVYAGSGNDTVYGGATWDQVFAGPGNDTVYAMDGPNVVYGETGDDMLYGGDDADNLYGGLDNDTLVATGGSQDILFGDEGNDVLVCGAGPEALYGGSGYDRVYEPIEAFTEKGVFDIWADFQLAEGDQLHLFDILPKNTHFLQSGDRVFVTASGNSGLWIDHATVDEVRAATFWWSYTPSF